MKQSIQPSPQRLMPWLTWSAVAQRLGSLRMAVCLLPLFAGVLFLGAVIESRHDRETAAEVIYRAWWFALLLGLLGVTIFFAAVKKWPWKHHQIGFLITHVGLLSLVTGGMVDSVAGTTGSITLIDSDSPAAVPYGPHTSDRLIDRTAEVLRLGRITKTTELLDVPFRPGPLPWGSSDPPPQRLDGLTGFLASLARPLGGNWWCDTGEGARLEVLAYHPHTLVRPYRPHGDAVKFPAVQVQLAAPQMGLLPPLWVAYHSGGRTERRGPALIEMLAANCRPEQIEEFLHPPTGEKLGGKGQLVVALQGKVHRFDVETVLGSTKAVEGTGCTLRLLQYNPDFQHLKQLSPTNPAVTFELSGTSGAGVVVVTAARQAGDVVPVRSASAPMGALPADFWAWYHPPDYRYGQASLRGLLQFATVADGRLCYRSFRGAGESFALESAGTVTKSGGWQRIWGNMNFRFEITDFLPHAGPGPYFEPVAADNVSREGEKTAALFCRLKTKAGQHEFWLGRTEKDLARVQVSGETFAVGYHPLLRDLGFAVTLLPTEPTNAPGSSSPSMQSSVLVLQGPGEASPGPPQTVTLNQPLSHNGYKLYQSGPQVVGRDGKGKPFHRATFIVNRDPGVYFKYAGSIFLALGIACMFYMKAYFFGPRPKSGAADKTASPELLNMPARATGHVDRLLFAGAMLTALALLWPAWYALGSLASEQPVSAADHSTLPSLPVRSWDALPVYDGRTKPFESECIEAVRQITGRTRFEGHDPVALVLAWVLTEGKGATPTFTDWDTYPFILCEHRQLRREIFGPSADKEVGKYVSPAELRKSAGFDHLAEVIAAIREQKGNRATEGPSEEVVRAEQVAQRLMLYDALCGKASTPLAGNVLIGKASTPPGGNASTGKQLIDLRRLAAAQGLTPAEALQRLEPRRQAVEAATARDGSPPAEVLQRIEQRARQHPDPLHLVGLDKADGRSWYSHSELLALQEGLQRQDTADTRATLAQVDRILDAFTAVKDAYRSLDATKFEAASGDLFRTLRETTDTGSRTLELELLFNRTQPFRWAWMLMFAAAVAFLVSLHLPSRLPYIAGFVFAFSSLVVQVFGFTARVAISGLAPVGNMYETVIFAAFMAASFSVILELIYRRRVFGLAGAGVATLGLLLADQMPLALDPKITPLVEVLQTNFWLTIHVLTIVCGYGAGTLAWGLGNLSLALLAFGRSKPEGLRMLAQLTYRSMQLTVVLLATGTFLGGWWAEHAWGRFWGWDPKEIGALVALVCYVVPLHARYVGWVKDYGLAVAAVVCYGAIILSWYVINFVLAAGMHSYGFSVGGGPWMLLATLLNLEWLFVASLLYRRRCLISTAGGDPVPATSGSAAEVSSHVAATPGSAAEVPGV